MKLIHIKEFRSAVISGPFGPMSPESVQDAVNWINGTGQADVMGWLKGISTIQHGGIWITTVFYCEH